MISNNHPEQLVFRLLQISVAATLAGYAWLCFAGKVPYSALLWNEPLLAPWLKNVLGIDWASYSTSYYPIKVLEIVSGGFLSVSLLVVVLFLGKSGLSKILLGISTFFLLINAVLYGIDRIFFFVQFAEYALQWSSPLFLLAWVNNRANHAKFLNYAFLACAITFAAHGLYALGVFPRPAQFVEMTMSILRLSENGAVHLLIIAGYLDILVALLVLVPSRIVRTTALSYMVVWGFLTTAARWVAHVKLHLPWWPDTLLEWTPEVLVRFPHFLAPLAALLVLRARTKPSIAPLNKLHQE